MVYRRFKRRRFRRRRYGRFRRRRGFRAAFRGVARKVRRMYKTVEVKLVETNNTVVPDTTGTVTFVSGVAQGLDTINRIGNKIFVKYIDFDCELTALPGTVSPQWCRLHVFRWKDVEGLLPTIAELYNSAPFWRNFSNFNRRFDFKTYYDKWKMVVTDGNTQARTSKHWRFRVKVNRTELFLGNNALVGNCHMNGLFYAVTGNLSTLVAPSINVRTRMRYTDLG